MEIPPCEQLRNAWEASGLSLDELKEASGVKCSADSLSRKLRDKQPITAEEMMLLAKALKVTVVVNAEAGVEQGAA